MFAILGTAISALVVGGGIYLLGLADVVYPLTFVQSFAFGSLISAVDPVATLAIFQVFFLRFSHFNEPLLSITLQALDVDPILNMLVFGESILNDAVSIVLTTTIVESGDSEVQDSSMAYQVGAGIGR